MRTDEQVDDHLLIARIVRRDATALEQLYARYRPRLWRYLLQQLDGDSGAVDDLLQEIFLAVCVPLATSVATRWSTRGSSASPITSSPTAIAPPRAAPKPPGGACSARR